MTNSKPSSLAERIKDLPEAEKNALIDGMSVEQAFTFKYDWGAWARPAQLTPAEPWTNWLVMAGRGFGKTRTGAETVRQWIKDGFRRVNIVMRTKGDIEKILIQSAGGILNVCPPDERPVWIGNKNLFRWPNGATSFVFTAEEPDALRGPEHEKLWMDELAAWSYDQDAWDMANLGLRIGSNPQIVITTTPRPTKLVRYIMASPSTKISRGSTYDNRSNLADRFYKTIVTMYEGTRLGRQELLAEVLDDNPGALFHLANIEGARVTKLPPLTRIVVALDPAVTSNEDSDEWGIIAVGQDARDPMHIYVLADESEIYTPDEAAKQAVRLYHRLGADRIIGEANNGGDMIEALLRNQDTNVAYRKVTASRGKVIRAEPVSALYEQHRVHHHGMFAKLEDEMTNWNPQTDDTSPNRLDACLVAGTLIATARGDVPIEAVLAGDQVMTRAGWRTVLCARRTSKLALIITVTMSNGAILTGTANHPVFTALGGFVRMDSLVCGDTLTIWSRPLSLKASSTPETPNPSANPGGTTSAPRAALARLRSIGRCGSLLMARFQRAITSTMPMRTPRTIASTISSVFHRRNTPPAMLGGIVRPGEFTPIAFAHLPLPGTAQMLEKFSTQLLELNRGKGGSRTYRFVARPADVNLSSFSIEAQRGFVAAAAIARKQIESTNTKTASPAPSAGLSSGRTNIGSSQEPAPITVVRSFASGSAPVYNLEVEGEHEYFANGILVHNCVWGITELASGTDGWIGYARSEVKAMEDKGLVRRTEERINVAGENRDKCECGCTFWITIAGNEQCLKCQAPRPK